MSLRWLVLGAPLLLAGRAAAQPPDGGTGGPAAPTHVLTPPAPLEMPAIAFPAGVAPVTSTAEVDVVLTVDDQGAVTGVEVTRSAGPAIDRAVVEGARRFRFRPATQDGAPIAVRLPFVQKFEPPPPPPAATAEPDLDAVIEGIVVTRGARTPIAGATVIAAEPEGGRRSVAVTDARGIFKLAVRSGTSLEVRVVAPEHEKFVQRERVAKDQVLKVKYLIDRSSYGQYESYVRAEVDRSEVSRTTLSGREITRVPGTFGDPFRVINVLPGVSSATSLLTLPIVRGSSPGNTGILLDGVRLPLLFHLFAGPSVIHPELIDHVDFYPGGFPVSYGGYTGGIVDGVTRAARPDERRVDLDLTLTQTGVLLREPITRLGVTTTVAGRIGYPGLVISLLSPDVSLSYWDYQARADGGRGRHHWSAFVYGAQDLLKTRPSPDQPLTTAARFAFHRVDLRYQHGDAHSGELVRLVLGYDDSLLGGGTDSEVTGQSTLGNGTWSALPQLRLHRAPASWLELTLGAESTVRTVKNPTGAIPATSSIGMNVARIFNQNGVFSASALFAELVWKPTANLRVIPGVRGDLYDERHPQGNVSKADIDPRLLARYRLTGSGVWLKGVAGRYHQPPRLFIPVPGLDASSLELGLLSSTQLGVGAEARLGRAAEIDVNTYYNWTDPVLFDLVVNRDLAGVQQPQPPVPPWQLPPPTNGEQNRTLDTLFARRIGRSYGLEVLLRRRDAERLFGWISYTLSRSERRTGPGWSPFDFDRLHILNFVAGLRLPRNWEFGARVLLQTGTPLTTIFGQNVTRSDGQFRLDLRVDKRAVWNNWLLDFYVDIINTTVAEESGGLVGGAPVRYLIPTVGFRGVL
jgi:TonB family protein